MRNPAALVCSFVFAIMLLPRPATADCVDYGRYTHQIGEIDTPGMAYGLAIAGTNAFIADGSAGLVVVDVTTPETPRIIGGVDLGGYGYADDVAVSGSLAFVAVSYAGSGELFVLDVADPKVPEILGSVVTSGGSGVAVSGAFAYVATTQFGLQVIDVSDPRQPRLVGAVDTPGSCHDVAVSGFLAYVADGTHGVQVIDLSDPRNPRIVGSVDTPGAATSIAIAGSHAYVADSDHGLAVIDISTPTAPWVAGRVDIRGYASSVAIAGNDAFVTAHSGGDIEAIDIVDPAHPRMLRCMRRSAGFAARPEGLTH